LGGTQKISKLCNNGGKPARILRVVDNVERLPDKIRAQLVDWFQGEHPYSKIYEFLTDAGFQVSRERIKDWNRQLIKRLKLEADKELQTDKIDRRVAKEFETQAIKGLMDFFWEPFNTLKRPKCDSINDYGKVAEVLIKTINLSLNKRKMEMDHNLVMERVREEFRKEFQRQLVGRPELVNELVEIVDEVADKLMIASEG
jgi:hypothetical protein